MSRRNRNNAAPAPAQSAPQGQAPVATGGAPAAPAGGDTFASRTQARLAAERQSSGENAPQPPQDDRDPDQGYPGGQADSAEDVGGDPSQDLHADDGQAGALDDGPDDLDDYDETPEGTAQEDDDDGQAVDWEKRYKDLQSHTQQLREQESEMGQEHAQTMSDTMNLRFQLEDQLGEATQRAEFMLQTMTGNANQYRNINWAQVPPDQVQQVQQQAQQAFAIEQQAQQAFEQYRNYQSEATTTARQREAAIAKTRLRRTIPQWGNDTYGGLREFATSRGMSPQSFNDITDPVIIEALHAHSQMVGNADKRVGDVKTNRRAKPPRGKQARRQARNAQGRYERAQVVPNQRGTFAEKTRHRLAAERGAR